MTTPTWNHIRVSNQSGVTEVTCHTAGKSLVWAAPVERELIELFTWLGSDIETRVLILTGTGTDYCTSIDATEFRQMSWRQTWSMGQTLLTRLLELNVLVIAAVNGPALIHSEIPVMSDIVLSAPEAEFADLAHFPRNIAPADGVQLVWQRLLGPTRASYFLLTGERLPAAEALRLGIVHEVVPRPELLPRARALAQSIAAKPASLIAYTKAALRLRERRDFAVDLSHSLAIEGLGAHALGLRGPE
jgi:enoyl-CoA hydratase/carnithine racemase